MVSHMLLAAQGSARIPCLSIFNFFADLCLIVLQLWLSGGHGEEVV